MTLGNVLKDANAALKKEGLKLGAMTMAGFNASNPASSIKEADGDHLMSALGVVMSCQAYLNPMPTGGLGNYQYKLPTPNQNDEEPTPNNSSTEAQREARN